MTKQRRMMALLISLVLLCVSGLGLAEGADRVVTVNLTTATDAELADAAAQIKAEQKARLKTTIQLDPATVTINKGATQKVAASVADLPDGVTAGKFTWSSSNDAVATVNNGTIKGTGAGKAVITCATTLSDGTEVTGEIAVTGQLPVTKIAFAAAKMEIMAGETVKPEITIAPDDATNKEYTLTSSDEKAVKVEEDGSLTAGLSGKATVTATANDGSGKSAKVNVTVVRKVGKYDDELTFQGIPWGSDNETVKAKLNELGFISENDDLYHYETSYCPYWPANDLLFADWSSWRELSAAYREYGIITMMASFQPQKKIGGYYPSIIYVYYLRTMGADGKLDPNSSELVGVEMSFSDSADQRGSGIFNDLLAKMEAQYGEFSKYCSKDLKRSWNKDLYNAIKDNISGAKMYKYNELGKDIYLTEDVICTLHGKNDTGIMLKVDSTQSVSLFYSKTDALERIQEIQKVLEADPDNHKEDAGV